MQWLFESFILGSSFSGLVFIVPDFGRKYPDEGKFFGEMLGGLGVRGGGWVEGGRRGSCAPMVNKLADRLWISIYTALAGCDSHFSDSVKFLMDFNPHSPRRL